MLYQITDGTLSAGGQVVLSHFHFEIKASEKIAVVGPNGAGKTTLLRLIAGELSLDRDDRRKTEGIFRSRALTVGMRRLEVFSGDLSRTVEEDLLAACPCWDTFDPQRFAYEQEYDTLFTGFGFTKSDKSRPLSSFSGGEQTKIALIRLLLEKPDILLLDEPTNHLDLETVSWLEHYLKGYPHAVLLVSHDRFFLDQVADVVYHITGQKTIRYAGNYTQFRQEQKKQTAIQSKAYERQQEEIKRLNELIERFKHKPKKAAFARSRKKILERMEQIEKPDTDGPAIFPGEITPLVSSAKWVLEAEHLQFGYEKPLMDLTLRIRRGQKIGILGPNGAGKTTFLKTVAGFLPPLKGEYSLGNNVTIGYFDQHTAQITSDKTVAEHFHDLFPSMTEKEVRSTLGAYLFGGKEAAKKVSALSGGEKSRLILAELLQSRPNLLILDEPTNHMDIKAKETLESAFQAYTGTILFVSHDRYFIRQVADSILIFEDQAATYYPFGYEHYVERKNRQKYAENLSAQVTAEDQALIASLKAVPKGERHRLRELPAEELYRDWQLRIAAEKLEAARREAEAAWEVWEDWEHDEMCRDAESVQDAWTNVEAIWEILEKSESEYRSRWETAWERWHEQCMMWYDLVEELGIMECLELSKSVPETAFAADTVREMS